MSENSRGRFTITLGRSGQVVNRGRNVSDIEANDSYRVSGIKRSVRDRLGSNGGSSSFNGSLYSNKRHREDSAITGLTTGDVEDARIGSSRDLRHKLLGKKLSRASESSSSQQVMDLREKLPRLQEPPLSRYDRPKQISESRESSMLGRVAESRGSSILGRSAESREGSMLGRIPESRGSSIWRGMPESRESSIWRGMPESRESSIWRGMPESRESSIFGRVPIRSRAETFPRMDSSRSDYSPWTLDHIRQRSPERLANSSLGFSLRRNLEEPQRRPAEQTYDGVRGVPCVGKKEMHDPPRPITASPNMSSSRLPTSSARLMPPPPPLLSQIPPPAGTLQNGPYNTDEPQTVDGLLSSLGLGKYAISFKAEEVDMASLRQMGENDLKELGIPMGPRKKILLALLPRSKRQP